MTETCGIITAISADFFVDRPDSVGPAMPIFECKCVDDDGNTVPPGEVGELWVRGAPVIKGYINRPDATAESITDGWLHTGDIARIDDGGFIYIVDRKKDMVLRGGENVYCAEVEACAHRHHAVAECCVFGVPDARLGEEVGIAVVLRDRRDADCRRSARALRGAHRQTQGAALCVVPDRVAAAQRQRQIPEAPAARDAHGRVRRLNRLIAAARSARPCGSPMSLPPSRSKSGTGRRSTGSSANSGFQRLRRT